MKTILSLCINLVILIISDAFAVKLIEGNRSVVKKDGATHTISKYYVVPNDFDPNNVTNSNTTKASQKTNLRTKQSRYSKSKKKIKDSKITYIDQVKEDKAVSNNDNENNDQVSQIKVARNHTSENNNKFAFKNTEVSFTSGQNDAQVKLQAGDNIAESTKSVSAEHKLEPDDLGNLQIGPLTKSINISGSVTVDTHKTGNALQNESRKFVLYAKDYTETNLEDELDDLILSKFSIAVHEAFAQNKKNFWKLVKLNIDKTSDDDELMAKIERLSLLVNIFTNLYEAAQMQKPFESMIDSIIDILQIPFIEKRNTNELKSKTNVSDEDYDEDCLRKCQRKHLKLQMDSSGTYLTEAEGRKPSNNLELENLDLQTRLTENSNNGYNLIISNNDRFLDEVTDDTELTNIPIEATSPESTVIKWVVEDTPPESIVTNWAVEDTSPESRITKWFVQDTSPESTVTNWVVEDTSPESKTTKPWIVKHKSPELKVTDDQPLTIESRVSDIQPLSTEAKVIKPWIIEDKLTENLPSTDSALRTADIPWHMEDTMNEKLPWHIEDKPTDNLTWHIEDKTTDNMPWHIEDKTNDNLPWHIEDKTTGNIPWQIEDKTNDKLPWHIEDKNTDNIPWHVEDKTNDYLPWHIEDKTNDNLPWHIEDKMNDNLPWHIQDRTTDNLPWHIEDRTNDNLSWHIEDKNTENLPWHIEDKTIKYQPWTIKQRTNLPWIIEDRLALKVPWKDVNHKFGHTPTTLYHSGSPSVTTHNSKIFIDPNRPSTAHWVKNRVKKPYHIYTYVIKPETHLYEIPNLGKIVNVNSKHSNPNLLTKSYSLSSSHSGKKVAYNNMKPSSSYHESRILSNPTIDVSHPGKSQWKHTNYVIPTYDTSNEVNSSDLLSDIPQDNNQAEYLVGPEIETNVPTSEPQTNSDEGKPSVSQEVSSHSGVLLPYAFSNPFEPLLNLNKNGPILTANTNSENPNVVNIEPNPSNPDINGNLIQHRNALPGLVSEVSSHSEYTFPNDNDESVYGAQQYPGFTTKASAYSEFTIPNDYNNPTAANSEDLDQQPTFIPMVPYHPEYTNIKENYGQQNPVYDDHTYQYPGFVPHHPKYAHHHQVLDNDDKPTTVYGENTPQYPDYTSKVSAHSEFTITNDYNNPTADNSKHSIDKHPGFIPKVPYNSEYTNVEENYEVQNPVNDYHTYQHPGFVPHHPKHVNVLDDNDKPTTAYGENTSQRPGYITTTSAHSEFSIPNYYNNPTAHNRKDSIGEYPGFIPQVPSYLEYKIAEQNYEKQNPVYDDHNNQNPGLFPNHLKYVNILHNDNKPTTVYGENTRQHPDYITKGSAHSKFSISNNYNNPTAYNSIEKHPGFIPKGLSNPEYTIVEENYEEQTPVNDGHTYQYTSLVPHHPKYVNALDKNYKPTTIYGKNTPQHPGFTTKAHSEYKNSPYYYNNLKPDHEEDIYTYPGIIKKEPHSTEYVNIQDDYDKLIPVFGSDTVQNPGSKVLPHTKYTNVPNHFTENDEDINTSHILNQNSPHYLENTDLLNDYIGQPTFVDDELTDNNNNPLTYKTYGHRAQQIQPSLVAHLHGHQPTELNYLEHIKVKMAPTYQLFNLDNLRKLHDAVIKTIEISNADIPHYRALINLRKIISIILILAEKLQEPDGGNKWYIKIFYKYNAEKNQHPLQLYVYKLIRQRWLHELMLILWKNNFDIHILQNPRMFSFLGSWQFPNYVQSFLEAEDLIYHDFDTTLSLQNGLQDQFFTDTYDDLLEEVPEYLENYVTNKVIQSYKAPNDGIVVSIAGVEVEPDANAIVNILQNYLHYKNLQQNVIIRDNKVEMLKEIILFLKQKGYGPNTIAELIHKLYSAVYLPEGKECQPYHPNFAKNMYDVVLPVLRRSGQ